MPHRWTGHSLARSQAGQRKCPCHTAPSTESASIPAKPIPIPSGKRTAAPPEATAVAATSPAPPSAPRLPMRVMPPLAPTATVSPKNSSRGGVRLIPPRLVAQVSAAAAARLPVTTHRPSSGTRSPSRAPSAAGPPLAPTCHASRRSPLGSRPARGGLNRPTTVLEMKKAARTAPPPHPVPATTAVPTSHAAIAPAPVSEPTRHAAAASAAAASAAAGGDTGVSRAPSRRGGGSRSAREAYRGSRTSRLAARAWRGSAARSARG